MMANAIKFTAHDVQVIIQYLPDDVDRRRLKLLPKILNEWARTDLPPHLSMVSVKARKERIKRMRAVGICSKKLTQKLYALDENDDRFWIMRELMLADGECLNPLKRIASDENFMKAGVFLEKLVSASEAAAIFWKKSRGQPRNIAASLVLMDIVAIYEWLTGKRATRRVDRDTNKDTGPFWEFAKSIWPAVFHKKEAGLSAAIRNWDDAVKLRRTGTRSPLLANLALRYSTWGIFDR